MDRLRGKVAVISGTGGGQGRAAALRFSAEGAMIVGCDMNSAADQETAKLVQEAGGTMSVKGPVDLGDPDAARDWIDWAAGLHGKIDILYNNASHGYFAPIEDMTVDAWRNTIRNELDIVFFSTKYAWPYLRRNGGVVINVGSIAGLVASDTGKAAAHSAAKGGVIALTRQLALEGAPHGIRVVTISPGTIATPGTTHLFDDPVIKERFVSQNMIKRIGRPEDVVGVAAMLASDDGAFITGANIVVDGGRVAG